MRELGRRGGVKSGEKRSQRRIERLLGIKPVTVDDAGFLHWVWQVTGRQFTLEQIAEEMRPVDNRGGSHDTDWRCPECGHFSSIKQRDCTKCYSAGPSNGRLTRAALRARSAEHRNAAILARFGL